MAIATEVVMARRPQGGLAATDFEYVEKSLPMLGPNQVEVRNDWMSLDPYMRLYLSTQSGAHPPLQVGDTLTGGAVGEVIESTALDLPVGTLIQSQLGWRDRFVTDAAGLRVLNPRLGPAQAFLGVLGLTGLTAYGGTLELLQPRAGESLFVSGAAGAVGSLVVQLARAQGARVIASAGSDAKGLWLVDDLGADAFINYKDDDLGACLADFAPGGLDMMFDNVGGRHLEAGLEAMARQGRIALCGAIELYEANNYRAGPANLFTAIEKSVTLYGFNAGQFTAEAPRMIGDLAGRLSRGELENRETVVDGLDKAVDAFLALLAGSNFGKMLVRL